MEVVSPFYLNVLLLVIKQQEDTDGRNVAMSRNRHDVGWYNVVYTGIFTYLSLDAYLSFRQ